MATEGDALVTLTVEVPGAPQTRAIAQAENADIVYFEVWNSDWKKKLPVYKEDGKTPYEYATVSGRKANIELTLVADQTYNFIFWAQNKECGAYSWETLKNVNVDYSVMEPKGNNDKYDAYYAKETIKVNGAINQTVVLYRPFAQLNFGASRMATSFGPVEVGKTEVIVTGLATSFNTLTGKGEGELKTPVTFSATGLAGLAADPDKEEKLKTENGEYTWIAMDYMLMLEDNDLVSVEAKFNLGMDVPVHHAIANVPLKKNYRTNIIGDLFAADAKLQIVIDQSFLKEDEGITVGLPEEIKEVDGVYTVEKPGHILWLSEKSNNGEVDFSGKTISFAADIDMMGQGFLPINLWCNNSVKILGNKHKVFNFSVRGDSYRVGNKIREFAGLFGTVKGSITDLHVADVLVEGNYSAGALVGHIYGSVQNCSATNVEINSIPFASIVNGTFSYDDGNNVGALIGIAGEGNYVISGNEVNGAVITGYRCVGGLIGSVSYSPTSAVTKVDDNTVKNIQIYVDQSYEPYVASKDAYAGKIVGRMNSTDDLSDNTVDENVVITYINAVENVEDLQDAIDNANTSTLIRLAADVQGDLTISQKNGYDLVIDGMGNDFNGVIVVDGKSATYTAAGFTVKNVNFAAESIEADACVRLGDGTNATRYTCNVTVEDCTFDVPGAVGVKSYTGGDKNLTIKNCTATANAHSLVQAKGIDGILVEGCKVHSKNGMNFNNSTNVVVDNCIADVRGYAARFGESSGGSGAAEVYTIKNSTLKSACEDGDAVIILRGTADYSTLTIENTTIEGTNKIANSATDAKVIIDGIEK